MNTTSSTNTLAAAFAAAALSAPRRPAPTVTPTPAPTPSPQLIATRASRLTEDELLLAVLRHSLTPADKFIARRTLLRAAPWEDAPL
jgi:hypothetical protein